MDILHQTLKKYWGYDQFRPQQEEIIQSVLDGHNTLALLPTGGGKSLCYQIPGLVNEGVCLVISPLIALMKDQAAGLMKKGIKAFAIVSGMHRKDIDRILDNCIYGDVKFLFVSPERLETEIFKARFSKMKVNLIAVDEAHCISQWGHDFRPSYYNIALIKEIHPNIPILALTATATPIVQEDIISSLEMQNPKLFKKSFLRDNIEFICLETEDKLGNLIRSLNQREAASIIYTRSRNATKRVAEYLSRTGLTASYYHAGMNMEERSKVQNNWMAGKVNHVVATNAFGMGIDKPDVRTVFHLDIPTSLEEYYQEAGRAGRDGKRSKAIFLFNKEGLARSSADVLSSFPELQTIKQVYRALYIYFDLAIGSGELRSFAFDLQAFARKYDLDQRSCYYAIKELERNGYLVINEAVSAPSRIMFRVNNRELYDFQVENPSMNTFIKQVLRNYEGVFTDFVKINENQLASQLDMKLSQVENLLSRLEKAQLLWYKKRSGKPMITFLMERLSTDNLFINNKSRNARKNAAIERIKKMQDFLPEKGCRQVYILRYFGEEDATECGICDNCQKKYNRSNSKEFESEIQNQLSQKEAPLLKEFVSSYPISAQDQLIDYLTYLESEEYIRITEGRIHWLVKRKI